MADAVRYTEGQLTGVGGLELFRRSWVPTAGDGPRAAVLIVHGMGEHSGRYEHVAAALTDAGYAVHAHDHRGHGRSQGRPGYLDRLANLVADIDTHAVAVRAEHPGLGLGVLGHSMGGLTAALWAQQHPGDYTALALSGPLAALDAANPATRAVARALSTLVPRLPLVQIEAAELSHDPAVAIEYAADPLVFSGRLPARTVSELAEGVIAVQRGAAALSAPLSIQHGELDTLAPPHGSAELFDAAPATDKRRIVYPGMFHEIFNEVDRGRVLADLTDWFSERLG